MLQELEIHGGIKITIEATQLAFEEDIDKYVQELIAIDSEHVEIEEGNHLFKLTSVRCKIKPKNRIPSLKGPFVEYWEGKGPWSLLDWEILLLSNTPIHLQASE